MQTIINTIYAILSFSLTKYFTGLMIKNFGIEIINLKKGDSKSSVTFDHPFSNKGYKAIKI